MDIGYLPVKFREVDHKDTQWFYWHEYIPLFEQQVLLWADLDPVSPNVEKKVVGNSAVTLKKDCVMIDGLSFHK